MDQSYDVCIWCVCNMYNVAAVCYFFYVFQEKDEGEELEKPAGVCVYFLRHGVYTGNDALYFKAGWMGEGPESGGVQSDFPFIHILQGKGEAGQKSFFKERNGEGGEYVV